ncbi:nuclease-related domain-containing protein [Rhodoferax sp. TS-BS-61-7]|uniref:nuclease-related domain-containing protein n=1 Tax=Rhodoferax sp. TS-BS-61-7 TaxID=2094194 RepID=UPI000CF67968|nr:nuclease-related domain-containing protein [Rhodoferax sp. TS-BS-61-7]PQA76363.1 nuclease [Rhodoferax sp. TS-BS-61-7]
MNSKSKRSPLENNKPLRAAGQSLTEQLQDEAYDHIVSPALLALMLVVMAGLEWFRYLTAAKPNPVIYTAFAAIAVVYAAFKISRAHKRLSQIKLGRDGERAVAEHLEWLRRKDFIVFHDVPSGDVNVDHVLIGPQGVFTIETKTHSKPLRGECKITVAAGEVFANGQRIDRNPVIQAKAQARWLGNFLRESLFQPFVWPAVVFPGWYVESFDNIAEGVWVLETKALTKFIENEPVRHSLEEVKAMASALRSYVRAQH